MTTTTKIKTRVDVLDLLGYYNIEIVLRGEEAQFKCPFHNDRDPSASINIITGSWTCYRCKVGGSPTDFVSQIEDWRFPYADKWLRDRYGGFVAPKSMVREVEMFLAKAKTIYYPEEILKQYKRSTGYWTERGFDNKTVKKWELGYDPYTQRATIPIRSWDGRLIGVQGRTVLPDETAKYVFIRDLPKKRHLYGLHLIDSDWVVVTESALATLRLDMFGIPSVSTLGSSVSEEQAGHLNSFKKVYMLFDNDDAGWIGMLGNVEKKRFKSSAWAKISSRVYIPSSEDYDDIDLLTKNEVTGIIQSSWNAHVHVPISLSRKLSNG